MSSVRCFEKWFQDENLKLQLHCPLNVSSKLVSFISNTSARNTLWKIDTLYFIVHFIHWLAGWIYLHSGLCPFQIWIQYHISCCWWWWWHSRLKTVTWTLPSTVSLSRFSTLWIQHANFDTFNLSLRLSFTSREVVWYFPWCNGPASASVYTTTSCVVSFRHECD